MGISLRGKTAIENYIKQNGRLEIKKISIDSIEYLVNVEKLSKEKIAEIFETSICEVIELLERNGIE